VQVIINSEFVLTSNSFDFNDFNSKKDTMSETSELSDTATSDKQDDKDADFNMDDYRHEIDSDDSFNESPENICDVNVNPNTLY